MGKILQYLGVSEEGQNRDILDAERLLEGMQMIYSQAPEGNKKDSFSVPLAEMTKIFIEKIKGIEPTPIPEPELQEELPFKEGDRFKIMINPAIIYTIVKIDDETIKLGFIGEDGNIYDMNTPLPIQDAKESFEKGEWVLLEDEELPFKVGDRYKITTTFLYSKDKTFTIESINFREDDVTSSFIDTNNQKKDVSYSINYVKEKFASGEWVLIKDEEYPYKINDKFKVQDTIEKFTITNINEDTVEIAFVIGDGTIDLYNLTKEEFLENVSLGRYIKITDEEFSPKPQKPKRTRKPKEETEQEKQIREILEINLDDIDL